ncbi:MAG: nucleotide exchange factor GrpE [Aquificae bacterium]|nr:nucleotide exchange factor GrpE [Aquificota bacterium]
MEEKNKESQEKERPESQDELKKELEQLKQKERELEEKLSRLEQVARSSNLRVAELTRELEQLKERYRRDLIEQQKYCYDKFALELLEVLDDLERALESARLSSDLDSLVMGVEMVYRKMRAVFEKFGIKEIEIEGKPFDPYLAEAVERVETDEKPEGTVVKVLRKGYLIHERVLRPAAVAVAVPPAKKEQES